MASSAPHCVAAIFVSARKHRCVPYSYQQSMRAWPCKSTLLSSVVAFSPYQALLHVGSRLSCPWPGLWSVHARWVHCQHSQNITVAGSSSSRRQSSRSKTGAASDKGWASAAGDNTDKNTALVAHIQTMDLSLLH
jgi:hypothetical protein